MNVFKSVLLFILICCSTCQSAQINIRGNVFTYNAAIMNWQTAAGLALTCIDLHNYISDIIVGNALTPDQQHMLPRKVLKEIGRMILAQNLGGIYNVPANCRPSYVDLQKIGAPVGVLNKSDIYVDLDDLKLHLLIHGHLGYYPNISFIPRRNDQNEKVNKMIPRGIFNINPVIANRVFNSGIPLNYLSVNRNNIGYDIDPIPAPNNLQSLANTLVNLLLSTENIQNTIVSPVNNGRFSLDFDYNGRGFPGILRYPIAINQGNHYSNRIKVVIQILNGFVEIVTMYPI